LVFVAAVLVSSVALVSVISVMTSPYNDAARGFTTMVAIATGVIAVLTSVAFFLLGRGDPWPADRADYARPTPHQLRVAG
jgi:hypothetical protein